MKTLKLNSGYICTLFVLAVTFFMTSCGYEHIDYLPEEDLEEQWAPQETPQGHLSSNLVLIDRNNPRKGAQIAVSTNNPDIYAQLTNENFKMEVVAVSAVDKLDNDVAENIDGENGDSDTSLGNTPDHFLTFKILEEFTNEEEAVKYTFGNELRKVLEKYKAQMYIQLDTEKTKRHDTSGPIVNNAFIAHGDGSADGLRTKLEAWYDYSCSGYFHRWQTRTGFYHSYVFRSCKWPWNSSTRRRYSSWVVTQDVVEHVYVFRTADCQHCY